MIPCTGPTGNATVFNTDQIVVHGNASATFDGFSTHTMGPGKTPESDGNSEIEVLIFEDTPTNLAVFGTAGPDTMRVASGGGVMLGSDNDVDVRARSAAHVSLQGGFGSDYLSGRGGYPSSIPGPATTNVTMFGGEGDDIVIDGPLERDQLQGNGGNDILFTHDLKSLDRSFGQEGFDQLTMDPGDFALSDVEGINGAGAIVRARPPRSRRARSSRATGSDTPPNGQHRGFGRRYAASRAPSRECRRDVSGVAAALATTPGCPTISVAVRARVIAV